MLTISLCLLSRAQARLSSPSSLTALSVHLIAHSHFPANLSFVSPILPETQISLKPKSDNDTLLFPILSPSSLYSLGSLASCGFCPPFHPPLQLCSSHLSLLEVTRLEDNGGLEQGLWRQDASVHILAAPLTKDVTLKNHSIPWASGTSAFKWGSKSACPTEL